MCFVSFSMRTNLRVQLSLAFDPLQQALEYFTQLLSQLQSWDCAFSFQ